MASAARFFSIIANEAPDSANDEQLSISLRFVNEETQMPEERFLAFSECVTGVTGEAIAECILEQKKKVATARQTYLRPSV